MEARQTKELLDQIAELHGSIQLLRKGLQQFLTVPRVQMKRVEYLAAVVDELALISIRLATAERAEDIDEVSQIAQTMRGFVRLVQGEIRALVGLVISRGKYLGIELLPAGDAILNLRLQYLDIPTLNQRQAQRE